MAVQSQGENVRLLDGFSWTLRCGLLILPCDGGGLRWFSRCCFRLSFYVGCLLVVLHLLSILKTLWGCCCGETLYARQVLTSRCHPQHALELGFFSLAVGGPPIVYFIVSGKVFSLLRPLKFVRS